MFEIVVNVFPVFGPLFVNACSRPLAFRTYHQVKSLPELGTNLRILNNLKKNLEELKAKRVKTRQKWYWVLKKDYKFGEVIEIE